jgi:hypothetical protein
MVFFMPIDADRKNISLVSDLSRENYLRYRYKNEMISSDHIRLLGSRFVIITAVLTLA